MDILDDVEFEIRKLELAPSDVLVVRCKGSVSSTAAATLRAYMERYLGEGRKVLVIDQTVLDLTVVTAKDAKRLQPAG